MSKLSRILPICFMLIALGLTACNAAPDDLAGSGIDADVVEAPADDMADDEGAEVDEAEPEEEMGTEDDGAMGAEDEGEGQPMGAEVAPGMEAADGEALFDAGAFLVNDPKAAARMAADGGASMDAGDGASTDADTIDALGAADAQRLLAAHNRWRANYNSPPLAWDDEIAAVAQAWADDLAQRGAFEHSGNRLYGENLWSGTAGAFSKDSVVDSWGSEVQFWDLSCTGGLNQCCQGGWQKCGHFTAVVWSTTTSVGCGSAVNANGNEVVVCNYAPPGNFGDTSPFAGNPPRNPAPTQAAPEPTVEVPEPTQVPPEPTPVPVQPTDVPAQPAPTTAPPSGSQVFSWRTEQTNIGAAIPDDDYMAYGMRVTQAGNISSLAVGVDIDHTYVGDLAIVLYHPDGSYAILRNQTGGDGDNVRDVYGRGGIPVAGLDAFRGKPLAGQWYLVVYDVWEQDTGTLQRLSLDFEYTP